jgi:hypothetical protein
MRGIDVLLGNDVLRRFKTLEIEYGMGKPKMRFEELPVSLVLEPCCKIGKTLNV